MITRVAERWGRSLDRQRKMFYSSALVESAHHPVANNVVVKDKHDLLPCATRSEAYSAQLLHVSSRPVISSFPTVSIPEYQPDKPLSVKQQSPKTDDEVALQSEIFKPNNAVNPCGIQMLSRSLHGQIFKKNEQSSSQLPKEVLVKIKEHLKTHNLWGRPTPILPDVDLQLPHLLGDDLSEHFERIAELQCGGYREKLLQLITHEIPTMPSTWNFAPGWTRYDDDGHMEAVEYPDEDAYVFDVEVCVKEGHAPTLATAVSNTYWYSWCSHQLFDRKEGSVLSGMDRHYTLKDLINLETTIGQDQLPLEEQKERIVIGHNVSYDRARVKEQYFVDNTRLRFVDTMSLHIAVSGITSYQRNILMSGKGEEVASISTKKPYFSSKTWKPPEEILEWKNVSSFNGLNDVHRLYCGGLELDKEKRSVFVTGSLSDIRNDFQQLVTYCARDVEATYRIVTALFPEYLSRFPHPVTLAGFLEMGSSFLPVNRNWQRYLHDSEDTYRELEHELTRSLKREADRACHLMVNEAFKDDPWLWDLDWSVQPLKVKKTITRKSKKGKIQPEEPVVKSHKEVEDETEIEDQLAMLQNRFGELISSKTQLFKKAAFLPGYPAWYRSLCDRDQDGLVGPIGITTAAQVVPKLLKLTWDGYPLYHCRELGWGYLVPGRPLEYCRTDIADPVLSAFPLKRALELFPPRHPSTAQSEGSSTDNSQGLITVEDAMRQLHQMTALTADPLSIAALRKAAYSERDEEESSTTEEQTGKKKEKNVYNVTSDRPAWHLSGIGPYDVGVPGCWFFRLPHKSGVDNNVGNPLAKDYLNKIEDGTLRATSSTAADRILKLNRNIIYWRNARDRITSQMVVWLQPSQLPNSVTASEHFDPTGSYGAIVPQVITSGTLTRRAVEATWMTASNAYKDRLGSELKSMIQVPPGFSLVGADVDSQELWIASLIGDAHFAGQHGSTAFGWMTLQGRKSEGTDMHSRTADAARISRDQAKVLNYGRIYGAGERFAKTLLMQFNHRLSEDEAVETARRMYSITKGDIAYRLNQRGRRLAAAVGSPDRPLTREELLAARKSGRKSRDPEIGELASLSIEELTERRIWVGGTESDMFNKLEEIAQSDCPSTPVLGCRISRALEPANVGREFMTSRINWVVQSSAVDYLHLMVVAMRYLLDLYKIKGRFCISIHDEVRYLVTEEDRYRAALALQITNLWTRAMFAHRLGLNDLPQAVAFFSSVDVDTVLRKETDMDCQTPSNPYGLRQGYGIPFGSSYDIHQIVQKTQGSLSHQINVNTIT